jgi:adenylate cyclase class 2
MAMAVENEVKLRIEDAETWRGKILNLGYAILHPRVHEMNIVCDTAEQALRGKRSLLRVRTAGETTTITFKGPPRDGPHKTREEIEFTASGGDPVLAVLDHLGFAPVFRYEKYRTEYKRTGESGLMTLDETPIGCYLELEGPAEWLDATAQQLGFHSADYITDSYGALYMQYCRQRGTTDRDMVFRGTK